MSTEIDTLSNWHEQTREAELAWINENLSAFQQFVVEQYDEQGRGAILVNTGFTSEEQGHPYWYLPQAVIEDLGVGQDIQLVRNYDPLKEIVLIFQKAASPTSTHRIPMSE